ncbi:GTPase Era [Parafilimonas sp.]|uniref:GTPase Era n=1 Tax=Parafilimonas sp. TaxID=1969739 RepID=UPI0039E33442
MFNISVKNAGHFFRRYPLIFAVSIFEDYMKAGFVNIFGRPNAGKSTLLNALAGEKLAIVSSKVQTTRHRIKAFLTRPGEYQVIFSDTPGIIEPKYKLHERMMQSVKSALEDADIALLIADAAKDPDETKETFQSLRLKVPSILVLNKVDKLKPAQVKAAIENFKQSASYKKIIPVSALTHSNIDTLLSAIIELLPEGEAFYNEEEITDLPTKFFVSEIIREKVYELFSEEIPYQTAVIINEFKEKESLIKIQADIIVQRESQKAILLGEGGSMIKKLGTLARTEIENFLQQKIFLQLFIKVKPKWRDNDLKLREYGY